MGKRGFVAFLLAIALVAGYMLYNAGLLDTRFWFYDKNEWKPFYDGIYRVGESIEAGSYDVRIQGKSKGLGFAFVYANDTKEFINKITVNIGDDGFHFTLRDGEHINVDVHTGRPMIYKKMS